MRFRDPEKKAAKQARKAEASAEFKAKLAEFRRTQDIKDAEQKLKRTEDKTAFKLEACTDLIKPSLRVYWDRVEMKKAVRPLSPDMRAEVSDRH